MNEHEYEPIPGLPAPLPPGESILWQGAPNWESLAYRAMRVRHFTIYFAILAVWDVAGGIASATPAADIALSTLRLSALALVALALLTLFAWLVARTTLYTITTRRVVLRIGVALPVTLQIPFRMIDAADLRSWPDGSGDVALSLRVDQRIGYLLLWPHARPWRIARPVPALRSLPDAAAAAQALGRALAVHAAQPARTVVVPASEKAEGTSHVPAAA